MSQAAVCTGVKPRRSLRVILPAVHATSTECAHMQAVAAFKPAASVRAPRKGHEPACTTASSDGLDATSFTKRRNTPLERNSHRIALRRAARTPRAPPCVARVPAAWRWCVVWGEISGCGSHGASLAPLVALRCSSTRAAARACWHVARRGTGAWPRSSRRVSFCTST